MGVPTRGIGSVYWDRLSESGGTAWSSFNVEKESMTVAGSYWGTGVVPRAGRVISKHNREGEGQKDTDEEGGRWCSET